MRSRLFAAVLAIVIMTAQTAHAGGLERFDRLAGTWKRELADKTVYETWRVLSDRTMEGESYVVTKKTSEKVLTESLLLVEIGPDVCYIPRPMGNTFPIAFRADRSG